MNRLLTSFLLSILWLTQSFFEQASGQSIDPIRFTISTNNSNIELNQEFTIQITAEYLKVSPNTAFVLKDANAFKLKLITPVGFSKTGGDYHDYIGTELSLSSPRVTYTL